MLQETSHLYGKICLCKVTSSYVEDGKPVQSELHRLAITTSSPLLTCVEDTVIFCFISLVVEVF